MLVYGIAAFLRSNNMFSRDFSGFKDMLEHLKRLPLILEQERDKIVAKQKDYRELVKTLYDSTKPFEEARPETQSSFTEELRLLGEMIAHCMVIGDTEILYTYAINLIKEKPARLSSFRNMDSYIDALNDKYKASQYDGEKIYLSYLISELQIVA